MKLFMLTSDRGFYKRRDQWVEDPQKATIWTTKQGAAAAAGHCSYNGVKEILDFEVEIPELGILADA